MLKRFTNASISCTAPKNDDSRYYVAMGDQLHKWKEKSRLEKHAKAYEEGLRARDE